jgi:peptidoglycan/LPS O-acetylase OafA/YrhL
MTRTASAVRIPTARRGPAGTSYGTFRRDVEGLRAVAVGLVVLFHAGVPGLSGGYVGADVFLVVSGYLVTSAMLREPSLTGFFQRRARRILPAACLVLVAVILAGRHGLVLPGADRTGAGPAWPALLCLAWPAALALLLMVSRSGEHRTVPFTLGCVVGASLAWSVLHAGAAPPFVPAGRAWEIGVGALLALAGDERHRIPHRLAGGLSWLGLVLIVASSLVLRPSMPLPGLTTVVPVTGALLVLAGRGDGLLGLPPLQWVGRISYPLYLWHWPVLVVAASLPPIVRGAAVLVSVGLAAITYVLVEQPIRRRAHLGRWF